MKNKKCFKGVNPTDVVVASQDGMKIYGIFDEINDLRKESKMSKEYAFASIQNIYDDIEDCEDHQDFCEDNLMYNCELLLSAME